MTNSYDCVELQKKILTTSEEEEEEGSPQFLMVTDPHLLCKDKTMNIKIKCIENVSK